ncbi:MAG: hydrogenase maturation nickel metallochaperone HypA [Polyangiales bacterium]
MHELSLAGGILQLVEDSAQREGFRRVSKLRVEAGALSGVDVHALRFALDAIKRGTLLDAAEVTIEQPAGRAYCFDCGQDVPLASRGEACPSCGSYRLQPTSGIQLRVLDMSVHD